MKGLIASTGKATKKRKIKETLVSRNVSFKKR
jgi:hypothetical protein